MTWLEAGSAASLEAVAGGTAHLAGLHLRDGETGEFNVPQARRALAATGGVVVAFARWAQGFVVAPGNPKAVRTAADLAREDVRLINREPGAGSRSLLDQMLLGAGVPPGAVRGYERQVASHFQVAGTVAAGGADAGIALAAAAEAYGLDFVPLVEVRFDVAIPADHLGHPAVALLPGGAADPGPAGGAARPPRLRRGRAGRRPGGGAGRRLSAGARRRPTGRPDSR